MIPTNLNECFQQLDEIFLEAPEAFSKFKNLPESRAVSIFHSGLGRTIRNEWGLWRKDSNLYKSLESMQLWHADDMSSIILTSYHRYLSGASLNLKEQIDYYISYWNEYEKNNGPILNK